MPAKLTAGQRWLRKARKKYSIPDSEPISDTLRLAAAALDRAEQARAAMLLPTDRLAEALPAGQAKEQEARLGETRRLAMRPTTNESTSPHAET